MKPALTVLEKLRAWLQEREGQVPPSTTLGKAIGYTVGQWPKLIRYLESPLLSPDNNACERAIRRNRQNNHTPRRGSFARDLRDG